MRLIISVLLAVLLVGCASPYRPMVTTTSGPTMEQLKVQARAELDQQLHIGMEASELPTSLQRDHEVTALTTAGGTTEHWIYSDTIHLFFVNGKLTGWRL